MFGRISLFLGIIILVVQPARTDSAPDLAGCAVFPVGNIWNVPVDTLPVDAHSANYISTIGATTIWLSFPRFKAVTSRPWMCPP